MISVEKESEDNILDFLSEDSANIDLILEKQPKVDSIGTGNGLFKELDENFSDLKNKPWYSPGVDISDYFNYGFNEKTYKEFLIYQNDRKNFVRNNDDRGKKNFNDNHYNKRNDDDNDNFRRRERKYNPKFRQQSPPTGRKPFEDNNFNNSRDKNYPRDHFNKPRDNYYPRDNNNFNGPRDNFRRYDEDDGKFHKKPRFE